ncbi:MAG: hypothetical protein P4L42_15370 [Desulfocapsaceae bacterium]|nr:hypothetical protein [Desulfocapsaceae bacterium]
MAVTTTKTYDSTTNQVANITMPSVSNPGKKAVTLMTYDTRGNMLTRLQSGYSETAAISRLTKYAYNTYGQIASITGPRTDVNNVTTFSYYPNDASQGNSGGNLYTVQDALGHITTYSNYNAFGQAQTITDPNGIVTTRVFNTKGLVASSTTAGLTTGYSYDPAGRLLTITLHGNRTINYAYSPAGQISRIADTLGNAISYAYDSENRRIGEEVHDPQNTLTRYANYGYDDYGRLNKGAYPGNAEETAEYDLVGNLVRTVNATAMQSDYQYDALNRLTSVTEAGIATAGYAYDMQNNISTVTDAKSKEPVLPTMISAGRSRRRHRIPEEKATRTTRPGISSPSPMPRVRQSAIPTMR